MYFSMAFSYKLWKVLRLYLGIFRLILDYNTYMKSQNALNNNVLLKKSSVLPKLMIDSSLKSQTQHTHNRTSTF